MIMVIVIKKVSNIQFVLKSMKYETLLKTKAPNQAKGKTMIRTKMFVIMV